MKKLSTWREVLIEQLAENREEAIGYLQLSLEEYQIDGDTPFFLLGFRTFVESQGGIAKVAKKTQLAPKTIANLLASDAAPPLDTLGTLLKTLGCQLTIEPLTECKCSPETEAAREENVA